MPDNYLKIVVLVFGAPEGKDLDVIDSKDNRKLLSHVVNSLTGKEGMVLAFRVAMGFTLQTTGDILGLSPARIRQIEAKCLRKMRHPHRSRKLKTLLPEI